MKAKYLILAIVSLCLSNATAQSLFENLDGKVEMQGSLASGKTPLWLNANRYGLSSLDEGNGYVRAALGRRLAQDSTRRWGVGYGADVAVAQGYTSRAIVQQAYVEGRWLKGVLTIGSKEQPMELKDNQLSSGSQTLGINARPIPQVRLALGEYWAIPITNGWVSLKGHISYGMATDGNWQQDFTGGNSIYAKKTLVHTKAGYIKIGNDYNFCPWSIELGLEMATQFGGKAHVLDEATGKWIDIEGGTGVRDFWNALKGGGSDATESKYTNVEGNMLGSYVARFNYDTDTWKFGLYADHFFEDHSGMFFADYNGYGTGEEWNVKKDRKYFLYSLKDIMLGVDLELKDCYWLRKIVFEYLYTKYQSGPIYHDHTQSLSDHIGGADNYYNHSIYGAWQHWGQVMGNPLYRSPIYNDDGTIRVDNNRYYAFHLGLSGNPSERISYRFLATYQKGFGSYSKPYLSPKENISLMGQLNYSFVRGKMAGFYMKCAAGADIGRIYGHNFGAQLTIGKTFSLAKREDI